ncbi:hypothetical protein BH11PSE10_BH11PSE10_20760 [soil metagenome]
MKDEWLLLQKQHEQYEFAALAIKGAAVALLASHAPLVILLLAVLWLQEAIIKTFQARLGARLLRLEAMLLEGKEQPMQLHTDWLASRPRGVALGGEYLRSACRPTVAFPYPVLMGAALLSF